MNFGVRLRCLAAAVLAPTATGACARGRYEVDMEWKDGRLVRAIVRAARGPGSVGGDTVRVRYGGRVIALRLRRGGEAAVDPARFDVLLTRAGVARRPTAMMQ